MIGAHRSEDTLSALGPQVLVAKNQIAFQTFYCVLFANSNLRVTRAVGRKKFPLSDYWIESILVRVQRSNVRKVFRSLRSRREEELFTHVRTQSLPPTPTGGRRG